MNEDPTRATAVPGEAGRPVHGSAGPADPQADPETRPTMLPVTADAPTTATALPESPTAPRPEVDASPTVPTPGARRGSVVTRTRTGGLWTGLIFSALVLVFLLIFIAQNTAAVRINFLGFSGSLPTGVALLFSAIAGLLLVAIPGGLRILQLRRVARRGARDR